MAREPPAALSISGLAMKRKIPGAGAAPQYQESRDEVAAAVTRLRPSPLTFGFQEALRSGGLRYECPSMTTTCE